ncbi:MAG: DUF1192 family protein [Dongiaceae bacterium]
MWDDEDKKPQAKSPRNLKILSVKELEEYIEELKAEIARVQDAINLKKDVKAGAAALFKK